VVGGHDAVAGSESGDAFADLVHDAGDFVAEHDRRLGNAVPLHDV